ncbi:GNAT family N-acetyltransferase [Aestuariibius sp. HNIBRBA575]|uniref:GNAT family N-acetyltransferase n=1 Tax=Aestuariibius sp. HNIBRBA575 TaxID=3233343 RepID=UPI0034A527B1
MDQIRQENAQDWWDVEALYDLCFAPGREALSSYRLRDGVTAVPELCLVMRDDADILGGAIRVWPVDISGHPTLLLGPVAVHPTRQGEGLGGALIAQVQDRARKLGWARILLVGDAPYYERFGFMPVSGVIMPPPTNPNRVLGYALTAGAWDGITGQVARADQTL